MAPFHWIILAWLMGLTLWLGGLTFPSWRARFRPTPSRAFSLQKDESAVQEAEPELPSVVASVRRVSSSVHRQRLKPTPSLITSAHPPQRNGGDDTALRDYNRLALEFSSEVLTGFRDRWHPEEASADGDEFAIQPGVFWFIPSGTDYGVLVPGAEVIRTWERFYRPMGGMQARTMFGAIYDIETGSGLRIAKFALARRHLDKLVLTERGVLSGI
jgi:hypothetical protein